MTAAAIQEIERRFKVPGAKEPDGKFATTIAAWARGASLGTVLDLADVEIGQTSPGDFVRNAKQVADLCEQLARMSDLTSVAEVAAAGPRRRPAQRGGRLLQRPPARLISPLASIVHARLRRRRVHRRRNRGAPSVLHEPRGSRLRAGQPARSREGSAVRALLALVQEPAATLPRRVRRATSTSRATPRSTRRSGSTAPTSSTRGSSSSTATTRWPNWAACTWPVNRRATSSPRSSSGDD